jgi:hypothetical protein
MVLPYRVEVEGGLVATLIDIAAGRLAGKVVGAVDVTDAGRDVLLRAQR